MERGLTSKLQRLEQIHNLDNQSFQNSGTSDTQKDLNGATQVAELISDWIN